MVAWSPILILGLGAGAGSVIRGCTGFGGAIVNLLVWVVFDSLGVDSGSLKQAVVTECVSSLFTGPLLLYMTRAWRNADWHITIALLVFTSLGAPLGAALLKYMDPRAVEGIMGLILLVVIALHVDLPATIGACLSSRPAAPADRGDSDCLASSEMQPLKRADWGAGGGQDHGVDTSGAPPVADPSGGGGASSSGAGDAAEDAAADRHPFQVAHIGSTLEKAERQGLQQPPGSGQVGRLRACWHAMFDPGGLRLLGMSSVAGGLSGIMGGLTGMGGPPTMLMFVALRVSKDTVRSCQAIIGCLQFRVVAYALLGEFSAADLPIYGTACALALAGLGLGDWWSRRVDQAAFGRLLVALMVLCAALMLGSAAGLGLRPHQGHGTGTR